MLKFLQAFIQRKNSRLRRKEERLHIVEFVKGGFQDLSHDLKASNNILFDKRCQSDDAVEELAFNIEEWTNDEKNARWQTEENCCGQTKLECFKCDAIISSVLQNTAGSANASGDDFRSTQDKFEDAFYYAEYQLRMAEAEQNESSKARAWFHLGSLYHTRSREMLQEIYLSNTTEPDVEMGDQFFDVQSSIDNNMTKALSCYCRSALITKTLGDYEKCGIIYGCIGNVLHLLGNFEDAIVFHFWRLKAAHRFGDSKGEYRALQNIGNEYAGLLQFEKAVKFYKAAKQVAIRMKDDQREERCEEFIRRTFEIVSKQAINSC